MAFYMAESRITRMTWAAGIVSVVGPVCAVLPYTDYLPSPLLTSELVVWALAAMGAIGLGVGVFAFRKGSRIAGAICGLTNIPVLAYWGFICFFVFILHGWR